MYQEILAKVDHTYLNPQAKWADIEALCQEAIQYKTASVCIPPSYVKQAKEQFGEDLIVCTVIGFPNGYNTTESKVFETKDSLSKGADEIDMVINIGWVKDQKFAEVQNEIEQIKAVCGTKILKVIIETFLLTEEEKIKLCQIVTDSGADYIKTSTGFAGGGATFEDVRLFKEHIGPNVKIKAAGGISTLEDAKTFIQLGAERLGTSRVIKLVNNQEATGY